MLYIDTDALLIYLFNGLIGIILLIGLSSTPAKGKTEVNTLLVENKKLSKRFKHTFGLSRILENALAFLQTTVKRFEDRNSESQLARERLNGELVRRERQIRSLEHELLQERNKAKGRR